MPDHLIALVLSRIAPTCYDVPHTKVVLDLKPTAYCECWTKCPNDQPASKAEIDACSWSGGVSPNPFRGSAQAIFVVQALQPKER